MHKAVGYVAAVALLATACSSGDVSPDTRAGARMAPPARSPAEREPTSEAPARTGVPRVRLEQIATLDQPIGMAVRDGDDALFFVEKTGRVVAVSEGATRVVLDISSEVSQGGEQGLLGLAFSPSGTRLYTNHTDRDGHTRITEWAMRGGRADPDSRREVLFVEQPFSNHNGGNLAVGPDGYLYIGLGDGGSGGDPLGNAQSPSSLLGKMLRIDPRPSAEDSYRVPDDNPFVGREGFRPEIWALGLRNPWRYSFDRRTGDLWIADVGQSAREEINRQPADVGGQNYGWDRLEGTEPFEGEPPPGADAPFHEYGRDLGSTVIGGYVYRGSGIPELEGFYVFGDFFNPDLRAIRSTGNEPVERELGATVENLSAFGEDASGELYALSLSGPVFKIVPAR